RLGALTGDGGVGHAEPGRLDTAAVVALHDVGRDRAGGVLDELLHAGRELAQVGAERLDERTHGVGARTPPRALEPTADEVDLLGVALERVALDDREARGGD